MMLNSQDIELCFNRIKEVSPLVHCITNYVTVHDVANTVLAVGASPVMSDDTVDGPQITEIASSLLINIGTLNQTTIETMKSSLSVAAQREIPIILDPVGAGATELRTNTSLELLESKEIDIIRGNVSELKALYHGASDTKGVDASSGDTVTRENLSQMIDLAANTAQHFSSVVAMTSEIDIVTEGSRVALLFDGHSMQGRMTGAGCMLSSIVAASAAANADDMFGATVVAVGAMGLAGIRAFDRMKKYSYGNATYSNGLVDELFSLDGASLVRDMSYEIR